MDRDENRLLEGAIAACIAMRLAPSVRNVARMTAALRLGAGLPHRELWRETVRVYLAAQSDTLAIQRRYAPDTPFVLKTVDSDTPPTRRLPPRARARDHKESKLVSNGTVSNTHLPTVGEAHTPWAKEVERRTNALATCQLRTTDHRQMHDVACLFVVRFMARKFTTDEAITRKAIGVAGQIRNVVTSRDHPAVHDLTVREFFTFGREVFAASGGYWERPWDVVTWAEAPEKVTP